VLALVVALLWVAGMAPPAAAQHQHTPGMQMPAAPAQATDDQAGDAMPAPAARGVPVAVLVSLALFAALVVLFVLARLGHWHKPSAGMLGGLALLVAVYAMTAYVVHVKKRPGQSTVWEATTMDMSAMKPIPGAAPVAIEKATCGPFTASVTYTGTVVALNDQDIYPRVTGRVVSVPVYAGDEVRPGELLVRLDDSELSGREREAAAGSQAALQNARAAQEGIGAAEAMRRQREQMQRAAQVRIAEATRMVQAARAKQHEAEKGLTEARENVQVARQEQSAAAAGIARAEAEADAARAALDNASAELDSAQADLTYWTAEIKRMKALLDGGAASLDEYQTEEAQHKAAAARVKQVQAMISERRSMVQKSLAEVREAQAMADRAQAQVRAMQAGADRMAAGVDTAAAEAEAAVTRVDMARADARAAGEEVVSSAAGVRVAGAQAQAMQAMTAQTFAALAVARTVRGYTEIRATAAARVLQRVVSPGTLVNPGTLLLRLAQVDRVRLQANVSQADLVYVRVGGRVWAHRIDEPDRPVVATVTSISPSADPAARTSVVEALVSNPRREFLPGQAVVMRLETASYDQGLTVPSSAVITLPVSGAARVQHAVWTIQLKDATTGQVYTCVMHPEIQEKQPGTCPKCRMDLTPTQASGAQRIAHLSHVTIGPSGEGRTVILSGVTAGQEIVARGHQNLLEGQTVSEVAWGPDGPAGLPPPPGGAAPSGVAPSGVAPSGHEGHGK